MASPWAQAKAGQKISAPKQSKYQGYRGQPGGSSSISSQGKRDAFVGLQRQKFFGDRDIPEERVLRRTRQEGGIDQFKQALIDKGRVLKDSRGNVVLNANTGEPVFLTDVPGGRSVSDVAQDLAFRFGPTPREIVGDIGYGIGSIGRGLGNFIGRGGVFGSVLSDLFGRVKGGAQQGIETVGDLYDNLRSVFSGQPTVVRGGGSTMLTTTNERPRVDLTPTSIDVETLPSINLGEESDPSIFGITNTGVSLPFLRSTVDLPYNNISSFNPDTYQPGYLPEGFSNVGIENPLFRSVSYEPIRVSDMDMTGVTAQNERPVLPPNVVPMMRVGEPMNIDQYRTPVLPPDITDPRLYQNQVLFAKDGGSVDKYAGLGYKLK